MRRFLPLLFTCSLLAAPCVGQDTFTGKVVALSDGDTLTVLRGTTQVKVRLHAVDAPETAQPFGNVAKQFTAGKCFQKTVTVEVKETDRYGRKVGLVKLGDGSSLNLSLVQNGYAWWYHQYGRNETAIAKAEIEARAARRGLWADANPQPPWAFRNPSRPPPQPAAPQPANPRPAAVVPAPARPAVEARTVYITRTGEKYHRAGCSSLRRSSIPISLKDAQSRGCTACARCGG